MTVAKASTALEVDPSVQGAVRYYSAPRVVRITDTAALEFAWARTPPGATTRLGALWVNNHADTAPLDEPAVQLRPRLPIETVATAPPRLPDVVLAAELAAYGLTEVKERLNKLLQMIRDDEEQEPADTRSLEHFVAFALSNPQLRPPDLGVSPQGHLQATWRVRERGMVVLAFRPDGRVRYSGASGPSVPGQARDKVSGVDAPTAALKAVAPLLARS